MGAEGGWCTWRKMTGPEPGNAGGPQKLEKTRKWLLL